MQLRDSYLWHCGKRMLIDPLDEEGQRMVTHQCVSCPIRVRAPGERPQRTASPAMLSLRERYWTEVAP